MPEATVLGDKEYFLKISKIVSNSYQHSMCVILYHIRSDQIICCAIAYRSCSFICLRQHSYSISGPGYLGKIFDYSIYI